MSLALIISVLMIVVALVTFLRVRVALDSGYDGLGDTIYLICHVFDFLFKFCM